MTNIFVSVFRCIVTLLHANYHYSQHQSLSDHTYSIAPLMELSEQTIRRKG